MRAEFEAAFDLVTDRQDRSSPAYRDADACYRAWIGALDGVALALLDDIDACEAACAGSEPPTRAGVQPASDAAGSIDIDLAFQASGGIQSVADLIGAAPMRVDRPRKETPRSRAMSVIGDDRVARHWNISLGRDRPVNISDGA